MAAGAQRGATWLFAALRWAAFSAVAADVARFQCPPGFCRSSEIDWDCGGAAGVAHFLVDPAGGKQEMPLPAGVQGFRASASAWVPIELHVLDGEGVPLGVWDSGARGAVDFARVVLKGSSPAGAVLQLDAGRGTQAMAVVSYTFDKIVPCPPSPPSCRPLVEAEAARLVRRWSERLRARRKLPADAWQEACQAAGLAPSEAGIPWHLWGLVWKTVVPDGGDSDWQPAFHRLDLDRNLLLSEAEFAAGYRAFPYSLAGRGRCPLGTVGIRHGQECRETALAFCSSAYFDSSLELENATGEACFILSYASSGAPCKVLFLDAADMKNTTYSSRIEAAMSVYSKQICRVVDEQASSTEPAELHTGADGDGRASDAVTAAVSLALREVNCSALQRQPAAAHALSLAIQRAILQQAGNRTPISVAVGDCVDDSAGSTWLGVSAVLTVPQSQLRTWWLPLLGRTVAEEVRHVHGARGSEHRQIQVTNLTLRVLKPGESALARPDGQGCLPWLATLLSHLAPSAPQAQVRGLVCILGLVLCALSLLLGVFLYVMQQRQVLTCGSACVLRRHELERESQEAWPGDGRGRFVPALLGALGPPFSALCGRSCAAWGPSAAEQDDDLVASEREPLPPGPPEWHGRQDCKPLITA